MMPVLFKIPFINWAVPGYGLMMMLGFLLGVMWAARRAMRSGANPDVVLNLGFIALIAGILGCRIMYVVHYWKDQFAIYGDPVQVAIAVVDIRKGGLEFYGGFILASICVVAYLVLARHSLRWYMDIVAPSAALGMAFGRMGCFLNGCCYGTTCDLPWKVSFPFGSQAQVEQWRGKLPGAEAPAELLFTRGNMSNPITRDSLAVTDKQVADAERAQQTAESAEQAATAALNGAPESEKTKLEARLARVRRQATAARLEYVDVRDQMTKYHLSFQQLKDLAAQYRSLDVHPAQLYAVITLGLLTALLSTVYWRRTRDGQVICTLFLIEPMSRWTLELLRADNPRDTLGITVSQFIAICMTVAAVIGFIVLSRMPPRSPRVQIWQPEPPPAAKPKQKGKARPATA
jgi:phosphatidylglycerol---prolipoprotein diacylglyceryl transferase